MKKYGYEEWRCERDECEYEQDGYVMGMGIMEICMGIMKGGYGMCMGKKWV